MYFSITFYSILEKGKSAVISCIAKIDTYSSTWLLDQQESGFIAAQEKSFVSIKEIEGTAFGAQQIFFQLCCWEIGE